MNLQELEKFILTMPYTKKRVTKKLQQVRFTVADYPFVIITASKSNVIQLSICNDFLNIVAQKKDYPNSIAPLLQSANKWNIFDFNNTIPTAYILSAIKSAYKFQLANMPKSYQVDDSFL